MKVTRNADGLFEFSIVVSRPTKSGKPFTKTLRAIVDTGSTDCACTHEVITTLQIKPIDFMMIKNLDESKPRMIYHAPVRFDGHSEIVPIIRTEQLDGGCHFILGMSILSKCVLKIDGDTMDITWK